MGPRILYQGLLATFGRGCGISHWHHGDVITRHCRRLISRCDVTARTISVDVTFAHFRYLYQLAAHGGVVVAVCRHVAGGNEDRWCRL